MTTNLQAYSRASTRIDNTTVTVGSIEIPVNYSITGLKFDNIVSIANSANTQIYAAADLADFEFLWIAADYDVRLLIGDTNSNTFSVQVRGSGVDNRYGVPFVLSYNHTTDSGNTINTITAFNSSGNTAKVRIFALD